jgi:hypothetical protein
MKKIVEMQSKKKNEQEAKRREELEKQKAREQRLATVAINVPTKSNILANKQQNNYNTLSTFKPRLLLSHQSRLQSLKPKNQKSTPQTSK